MMVFLQQNQSIRNAFHNTEMRWHRVDGKPLRCIKVLYKSIQVRLHVRPARWPLKGSERSHGRGHAAVRFSEPRKTIPQMDRVAARGPDVSDPRNRQKKATSSIAHRDRGLTQPHRDAIVRRAVGCGTWTSMPFPHEGRMSRTSITLASIVACATFGVGHAADMASARQIASGCSGCHGTNGVSLGQTPSIAGMPKAELVMRMQAFKSGQRPGTVMPQLAKGYTDEQIELAAEWFAQQAAPTR